MRELIEASLDQGPERSGYHFVVARDTFDIAGFACYGPRPLTDGTFDLYWIVVPPRCARTGIGGCLLEQVVQEAQALGARLLVAETSGLPQYLPARTFYLRHGFVQEACIADFYGPGDDLMLYVRRLGRDRSSTTAAE